jgi:ketosteroid isomerase-like protein
MKNILYLLIAAMLIVAACQPKSKTVPVDVAAEKDSISKNMEKMYAAYSAKDANTFLSFLTEDCLYCGTDSKEFWDKEGYSNLLNKMCSDSSYTPPAFTLSKREIRLGKSGNSAIIVDQLLVGMWTEKISLRNVTHFIKTDNKWMVDFTSMSFVPNNEDLAKIFKAVEE